MEGDSDANFIHYAIQKLHWSPSQVNEFMDSDEYMKSLYYASIQIKMENDKKRQKEIERKSKK